MGVRTQPPSPTQRYWNRHHVVYRFYEGDRLIYIGASSSPAQRMANHRSMTTWFHRVTKTVVKVYPTRSAAFAAEWEAIRREKPELNSPHRGPRKRVPV